MSRKSDSDDVFYLGYQSRMPRSLARFVFRVVALLILAVITLAFVVPRIHKDYEFSRSDFRDIREFEGVFFAKPASHLIVPRPGETGARPFSRYLLVGRGKSGPKIDTAALDGQYVQIKGSLIYRDEQTLISVRSGQKIAALQSAILLPPSASQKLGTFTLTGEIIDSKCFGGTMRPGNTAVHRACAIRCIAGGIPPMILVRDGHHAMLFLLVDSDGSAVNERVLDLVADTVQITGEVHRMGDMFVIKADPDTYKRL